MLKTPINKLIAHPEEENPSWRATLNKMEILDFIMIDTSIKPTLNQVVYRYFHKPGTKRFKSTTKGQPAGKVKIWREA